jgi:hypothetical protein
MNLFLNFSQKNQLHLWLFLGLFLLNSIPVYSVEANTRYSLELKIEPQLRENVRQLIYQRISTNHGFSNYGLEILIDDFTILGSLQSSGAASYLFSEIFSNQQLLQGPFLLSWFMSKVRELRASDGSTCANLSSNEYFACADMNTNTISLSANHFKNDRLRRILTYIHERRHFDGYNHVPNTASFDNILHGSNGAQLSFLVSLINTCTNCTIISKRQAVEYKNELLNKFIQLSSFDQNILRNEVASIKPEFPPQLTQLLNQIKQDPGFVTVVHFECKNGIPLYEYAQQHKSVPNVDANDCFTIYYKEKLSPHIKNRIPENVLLPLKVQFLYIPISDPGQ